jgi:hypothetical protein
MKRTLLALCLGLVSGLAFAGEAANSNGYDAPPLCPKAAAKAAVAAPVVGAPVGQAPSAAARSRGGGGGATTTRLASPRWHSLLPGMFR